MQPSGHSPAALAAIFGAAASPSSPFPIAFTLTDADGIEHTYEAIPHPASDGAEMMWLLLAMGAEPLARLAAGVLQFGEARTIADLLKVDIEALAAKLDWSAIGSDIKKSLLSLPMTDLSKKVLAHTLRDGMPLREKPHFDAAFTRNYGELLQAVWHLVRENRFLPPLPTLSSAGNGATTSTRA